MFPFELYNPTKLIFGQNKIETINNYIDINSKILLVYGGGSIKENGIYDKIIDALKEYQITEFSGIEANPKYETLTKAVDIAKKEKIDFILAIGGGSVIDGVKFISAAINYEGNSWEMVKKGGLDISSAIPFGTVLTLPATGSEMNSGAVITNEVKQEKLVFANEHCFPQFSILDPSVVASLPKRQIANGIVDAFVHTLEQYITDNNSSSPIQDGFSETILKTLIEIGPKIFADPKNIELAEHFMFSATMALNGLIGSGVKQDWATHMIGHELTAVFEIDHAQTLAIVLPGVWEVMFEEKKTKLAQYGRNVLGLEGSDENVAEEAIEKTEVFFQSFNILTRITEHSEKCYLVWEIPPKIKERGWKLGENKNIDSMKVEEILKTRL